MNPEVTGHLVIVLVAAALVASAGGWTTYGRALCAPLSLVLLGAAAAVAGGRAAEIHVGAVAVAAVAIGGLLAVVGGGPITTLVFDLVDSSGHETGSLDSAGEVLRGGVWIGSLERLAIYGTLVAGWPEGVAIALAVKGLGRYAELRTAGAAERFIVGTFTSVLWAVACAGVIQLAR